MSKADISIEAPTPLVENTIADRVQRGATGKYGFLGGYRVFFNEHGCIELSYGYTHNAHTSSLDRGSLGVMNNSDKVSPAYVFGFPAKRWSPLVPAGAGTLIFDPGTVAAVSTQTRLGYLYGGYDFDLTDRVFPRKEHRGSFYHPANLNLYGLDNLDRFSNRVEPAVVFRYSF
jgi:hypothetical protein